MIKEVAIPINTIIEYDLGADDYITIKLASLKEFDILVDSSIIPDITNLFPDWLTGDPMNPYTYALTPKAIQLMGLDGDDMDKFISTYLKFFKNTKQGALTHPNELTTKFQWFFNNHEFTKEIVLLATAKYISHCAKEAYMYMSNSGNFIKVEDKMGNTKSTLANWCLEYDENDETEYSPKLI